MTLDELVWKEAVDNDVARVVDGPALPGRGPFAIKEKYSLEYTWQRRRDCARTRYWRVWQYWLA